MEVVVEAPRVGVIEVMFEKPSSGAAEVVAVADRISEVLLYGFLGLRFGESNGS